MKRISIIITALLAVFVFSMQAKAQQVNVTAKAKQAFQKKFPNAQNVHWGKETPSVFEAEFTMNGKKMSANFDRQGNWKETEMPVSKYQVPSAVKQSLKRNYRQATLKQAFKVSQPGRTVYEMEVTMYGKTQELVFMPNGQKVNKGESEESGENGENGESAEGSEESGESGELDSSAQNMAQQVNVTAKAKQAFQKKFPNAQNVHWGKETPSVFEAEFTMNGKKMSANFDRQGNWKETEMPVSKYQVPRAVKQSLKKNYGQASLKQAYKVSQPGRTVYEMEVQINNKTQELVFMPNGQKVNKGESEESGENGEKGEDGENGEGGESGESSGW